jgi:hypothetical protein
VPSDRKDQDNMALLTTYYERPSSRYPEGRCFYIANDRQIWPQDDYPLKDPDGSAVDEPALHPLSWVIDPEDDRDMGLVEDLIDPVRGAQDCLNKISEWKNRCLVPKILAPINSIVNRPTDEPGQIVYYKPTGPNPPTWEQVPQIPQELFQFQQVLLGIMQSASSDTQLQAQANLAAQTVQAVIEQDQSRWQDFLASLAELHSRVARHCLTLVARHYSEERLLALQGPNGPDLTPGFRGKDLLSQTNVRVFPESLQAVSQQAVEQRATNWAQLGWISPTAAMRAINAGTTDGLLEAYMDDVGRMNTIIQRLKLGPDAVFNMPQRWDPYQPATDLETGQPMIDPETGQPVMGGYVPGWMPRKFDDADVQLEVLTAWMKGNEFQRQDPSIQEAAYQIFDALTNQQLEQQAKQQAQIQALAEQQGMNNAGKPQTDSKPMPSQPAVGGSQNGQ